MSTLTRGIALLACAVVSACGDSSVGSNAPKNLSGNWYFVAPSAPPTQGQLSEVGAALRSVNGQVTGNANVALTGQGAQCGAYALDLPLTGTVDAQGHLALRATDNVDTFSVSGTLAAERVSGTYQAVGDEAYPQRASAQTACTMTGGSLNGILMEPVTATYAGTLRDSSGDVVQVQLTTHQDTLPIKGGPTNPHTASSNVIVRGRLPFMVGGFFVTGTMRLSSPVCGVTTGTIQSHAGYVWGTVLQVEFDTDSTDQHGATFATFIDPTTGSLNVGAASVYDETRSPICLITNLTGTLTRQ